MNGNGNDISPKEFGALQAEVTHLRESVDKLELAVERLNETLAEMQGGKKLILAAATLIASVAGGLGWLASHIKYTP